MYGGLIGTHQRSFECYHPRTLWPPLSRHWGFATQLPPLISGTGKATDFKFGVYIYRAYPNKSPLKILEKRERGRIQGLTKFFGYPLLSQERVKQRTSNFVGTFIGRSEQKPMITLRIVAVGVVKESRKFSWHPYIARIARSSLRQHSFLVLCQCRIYKSVKGKTRCTFSKVFKFQHILSH